MTEARFPRGRAAMVGWATHGMGEAPGQSSMDLAAGAGLLALDSAGLTLADVDALYVALPDDMLSGLSLAEYYGIHPKVTGNNRTGGSAFLSHAIEAALALDAGLCDVALITYGSNTRTNTRRYPAPPGESPYETAYRPNLPASYALAARRHMHEFGTTREQLAEVAVAARKWANLNPDAYKRGDLSIDDVISAPMVASPLTVRDCCLVTDGAAAVVMTRADRARDLRDAPAYLLGGAAATTHRYIAAMPDLTVTAAAQSGPRAFAHAGLAPSDVDVLQLYDAFTINVILFLEDLGFCPKGEGGRFVEGGAIAPGGTLPVNTNGGGLSCVHPGMYGLFTMVEACRQIAGEAGDRQVDDVNVALSHGNGGVLSSQATLLLGSAATL
ncbi:thiolase [Pseudooceanicola sp. 216_PA32_1]|uniref:Thiolase n=1 Tax=Pseudooceanicola pacificus TaxID=2676438 RepID=A0A844WF99_9RHOB|nr:acetyl-CoA acetyltransferase [Pseudooceanicola pacificus]MWB78099.1 thiolase [Pseudooceanicola pacificus]